MSAELAESAESAELWITACGHDQSEKKRNLTKEEYIVNKVWVAWHVSNVFDWYKVADDMLYYVTLYILKCSCFAADDMNGYQLTVWLV